MDGQPLGSSFRDPSGFVFTRSGVNYRQVNRVFQHEFEAVAGSGLGLPLVAIIVERHGGWVDLRSREGKGTSVTIALPVSGGRGI
ncbi:MAG: ATP-binding protein [Gemmatimonadales bacterium]